MSVEKVRVYLETLQLDDRIIVPEQSSATVDETAIAVVCEGKQPVGRIYRVDQQTGVDKVFI